MTARSFEDFYGETNVLYQQQRYADVLNMLVNEGPAYPDHAPEVLYLRSCMEARTGQTGRAIATIREAVDAGFWYGERAMRLSPSWQPLQGIPDFERLVTICMAREADAQGSPQLFVAGLDASSASPPYPTLIALHGNGADGPSALAGWSPITSEGWLLAAPESSQLISMNQHIWDDQDLAMQELAAHFETLSTEHPIDHDRIVLAGFSMGGETALRAALSSTVPVRGFVLLGPGGPGIDTPEAWIPLIEGARDRGLRGYVLMGELDNGIPQPEVRTLVRLLNEHGIPCELEIILDLRHDYPHDAKPHIARALTFLGLP